MPAAKQTIEHVETLERYQHGFVTDIAQEMAPKGLSEATVRYISAQKNEPEWMLAWRLGAFERWLALFAETAKDVLGVTHAERFVHKSQRIAETFQRVIAAKRAGLGLIPA